MTTNDVVAKVGKPSWEEHATAGSLVWHYQVRPFPADEQMQGTYVVAFTVGITNGRLAQWGCAYFGGLMNARVTGREPFTNAPNRSGSNAVTFFVVRDHPVDQGRFVDSERLPKLGYISPVPELAVNRLKGVTLVERTVRGADPQTHTVWVFECSLDEQFVRQFAAMTTSNVAKRVLIMVGDVPIVAPTVLFPVEDGRFEVQCQDRSVMLWVKEELTKMER